MGKAGGKSLGAREPHPGRLQWDVAMRSQIPIKLCTAGVPPMAPCPRLWREGAMQGNPCYARLFADLTRTPQGAFSCPFGTIHLVSPNPIIASGGCGPRTPRGFFDRLILVSCLFSPFQFLGFSASYTTRARKANPFTERKNFFAGDGKAGRQKYLRNPLGICYNLYVKNSPLAGALLGSTAAGSNHFIKTGKGESPCRPQPARKPYWLRTPI